jgi:hypothetical protein
MDRPLTERERGVLDALLSAEFVGAEDFRRQSMAARVVGRCGCGCPSIDFTNVPGNGLTVLVDAGITGTDDSLFLFSLGDSLGGIEYVGVSEGTATELPEPSSIFIV